MAQTVLLVPFRLTKGATIITPDPCWSYKQKENEKGSHVWALLWVMNEEETIGLDPWPSGGWTYESDWTLGKKK